MRDLCLRSCRTPDGDGEEWERLILLHCGVKMGDIIVDCLNGIFIAIDCIYVSLNVRVIYICVCVYIYICILP